MSDLYGYAAIAGLVVTIGGACLLGWAAGDLAFGPSSIEPRAKRMGLISIGVIALGFPVTIILALQVLG